MEFKLSGIDLFKIRRYNGVAMKPLDPTEAAIRRGIKMVAVGKKGSKPLPAELIEEILIDFKEGKVAPVEKGAFFGALIMKGVTKEEKRFEEFVGAGVLDNPLALVQAVSPETPAFIKEYGVRLLKGEELTKADAERLGDFLFSNQPGDGARGLAASILRVRYETPDEYEGLLKSLHKTVEPAFHQFPPIGDPIIQVAEPFDGVDQSNMITPLVADYLQKLGYRVVNLIGRNSGPKLGNNLFDLVKFLNLKMIKGSQELNGEKPDLGWYIDQKDISKPLDRWVDLRRKIIKRPFLATIERFVNPVRADITIASAFHPPYGEKMITACERVGYPGTVIVRNGIEGTIAFPLKRPVKMLCSARQSHGFYRREEFELKPEDYLKDEVPVEEKLTELSAEKNAELIRTYLKEGRTSNELFDQRIKFTCAGLSKAIEWIKSVG